MGATRTIRRALVVAACPALLGACHSDAKPGGRRPPTQAPRGPASAVSVGTSAEQPKPVPTPTPAPSAVVQTLRSLREQRLEIAPPATPSERLAFGTGRLLQASLDKATFRDSQQGQVQVLAEQPVVGFATKVSPRVEVARHGPERVGSLGEPGLRAGHQG